jgi:S1-C subfamily serine protease
MIGQAMTTPDSIGAQATAATASEATGNPATAATASEAIGNPATATPAPDSTSAAALASTECNTPTVPLTPEQAAIAQATVQLSTPVVTVGPNGELTESTSVGSGFIVNGNDGQQYIITAGHVPAATGQDGVDGENGQSTYAEGSTEVTFADGRQGATNVIANNTSITSDNGVELIGNPDVAVLPVPYTGPTLPYPALQIAPNAQPSPGDTLTAYGVLEGQPNVISSYYLGMVTPSQVATNTNDTTPMLETAGAGVHGMSGGPVVDSNGDVVGFTTEGSSSSTLDTPISNASNLIDGLSPLSPNWLYNILNSTPQPIATPNDTGNGFDQTITGVSINRGGTITYLDAPPTSPAPATAPATDAQPAAPPATDAPPAVTPATDAPPAVTPATDAPPAVSTPTTDVPAASDAADGFASLGDFFSGGGGGSVDALEQDY